MAIEKPSLLLTQSIIHSIRGGGKQALEKLFETPKLEDQSMRICKKEILEAMRQKMAEKKHLSSARGMPKSSPHFDEGKIAEAAAITRAKMAVQKRGLVLSYSGSYSGNVGPQHRAGGMPGREIVGRQKP